LLLDKVQLLMDKAYHRQFFWESLTRAIRKTKDDNGKINIETNNVKTMDIIVMIEPFLPKFSFSMIDKETRIDGVSIRTVKIMSFKPLVPVLLVSPEIALMINGRIKMIPISINCMRYQMTHRQVVMTL